MTRMFHKGIEVWDGGTFVAVFFDKKSKCWRLRFYSSSFETMTKLQKYVETQGYSTEARAVEVAVTMSNR